jgi:hypothetical protein
MTREEIEPINVFDLIKDLRRKVGPCNCYPGLVDRRVCLRILCARIPGECHLGWVSDLRKSYRVEENLPYPGEWAKKDRQ